MEKQNLDNQDKKSKLLRAVEVIMVKKNIATKAELISKYLIPENGFEQSTDTLKNYLRENNTTKISENFLNAFIKLFPETKRIFFLHKSSRDALDLQKKYGQTEEEILQSEEYAEEENYEEHIRFQTEQEELINLIKKYSEEKKLDKEKILNLYNYSDEILEAISDKDYYLMLMLIYIQSNDEYKNYFNQLIKKFNSTFNVSNTYSKQKSTIECNEEIIELLSNKMYENFKESRDLNIFIDNLQVYQEHISFLANLEDDDWNRFYQLFKYKQLENWKNVKSLLLFILQHSYNDKNILKTKKEHHNGACLTDLNVIE